jgi:hypothetical protein
MKDLSSFSSPNKTKLSLPNIYVFSSDESHLYNDLCLNHCVYILPSLNTNIFTQEDLAENLTMQINNIQDWERIKTELNKLIYLFIEENNHCIEKNAFSNLRLVYRQLKDEKELSDKKIKNLEVALSEYNTIEKLTINLSLIVKNIFDYEVDIVWSYQVLDNDLKNLYPLGLDSHDQYIKVGEVRPRVLATIYSYLSFISPRFDHLRDGQLEHTDAVYLLQKIPFPIALIDKNDELLLHNEKFLNLNISIKNCLAFEHDEQVEINKSSYKVNRKFIENDTRSILFYLYPLNDLFSDESTPSNEEMGIVSSSIAHELNNPLAGILAAIEVICLDEVEPNVQEQLDDMKEGVLRCKELVETFLGFSRATPHLNFKDIEIFNSFKQSIELLRFRLIENKVNLILNHDIEEPFELDINPHVLVMIFYLLLGDLLTNYTHRSLITYDKKPSVLLEFLEKHNAFVIKTPKNFGLDNDFIASRLLKHLMETQNLMLSFTEGTIEFSYK